MKILLCILTSSKYNLLEQTIISAEKQYNHSCNIEIVIIVNTMSNNYFMKVNERYGTKYNIIRTRCNGRAGMGHNSVINVFKDNISCDYMFMVDEDDFLYPYAINQIETSINLYNPDILNLCYSDKGVFNKFKNQTDYNNIITSKNLFKVTNDVFHVFNNNGEPKYKNTRIRLSTSVNPFIDYLVTPCRFMLLSRKGLELFSKYEFVFDESMYVYDDLFPIVISLQEIENSDYNIIFLGNNHILLYMHYPNSVSHNTDHEIIKSKNINDTNRSKYYKKFFPNIEEDWNKLNKVDIKFLTNDIKLSIDNSYKLQFCDEIYEKIMYGCNIEYVVTEKKKILFVDNSCDYNFESPYIKSMGGTESAILFLAQNMKNYKCVIMNSTQQKHQQLDTEIIPFNKNTFFQDIGEVNPDYIIIQGSLLLSELIRKAYLNIPLYIWNQHDINVNFVINQYTNKTFDHINGIIFVSHWQKFRYIEKYNIPENKTFVMQNAISDVLYKNVGSKNIIKYKNNEDIMIFSSKPYRGLTLAFQLFPIIKKIYDQLFPNKKIVFKIFSSFENLREPNSNPITIEELEKLELSNHDKRFMDLYKNIINTDGMEFYGCVSQKELFKQLISSKIFFYPSYFEETCCTSVLEAIACGCNIVTTNIGAVPETLKLLYPTIDILFNRNFDSIEKYLLNPILIDEVINKEEFITRITNLTIKYITEYNTNINFKRIEKQLKFIQENSIWKHKSYELLNIIN